MEDPRAMILREWYQVHAYAPNDVVIGMEQYLPHCYRHNAHVQMLYISTQEFLRELPELIRFHGIARDRLEQRIDELAKEIYSQFPDYRAQTDIVRVVEDATLMLLNVGDELFHKLHDYRLYSAGGFHHYQFDKVLAPDAIALKKMPWRSLVNRVTHPDHWMWLD